MKNQPFLTFYKSRSLMDHGSLVLDCDAPGVWQDKRHDSYLSQSQTL